jgi:hypothetical protein
MKRCAPATDVIGPAELDDLLQAAPPGAILTGVEDDDARLEQPLVAYAQAHGFVPVPLPDKSTLWLAPQAQWAETMQLGGHDLPNDPLAPGEPFVLTLLSAKPAPDDDELERADPRGGRRRQGAAA